MGLHCPVMPCNRMFNNQRINRLAELYNHRCGRTFNTSHIRLRSMWTAGCCGGVFNDLSLITLLCHFVSVFSLTCVCVCAFLSPLKSLESSSCSASAYKLLQPWHSLCPSNFICVASILYLVTEQFLKHPTITTSLKIWWSFSSSALSASHNAILVLIWLTECVRWQLLSILITFESDGCCR